MTPSPLTGLLRGEGEGDGDLGDGFGDGQDVGLLLLVRGRMYEGQQGGWLLGAYAALPSREISQAWEGRCRDVEKCQLVMHLWQLSACNAS